MNTNNRYEIIWTDWPQIQKPFSEREIAFINTLNPREDTIKLSKYLKFRDVSLSKVYISLIYSFLSLGLFEKLQNRFYCASEICKC